MELRAGERGLLGVAAVLAAVFVGLGVWQLDRLAERRAVNAVRSARAAGAPITGLSAARLPADSLVWRRVQVAGRFDYGRELVLRGRAYRGTPGVHVVTPLILEDGKAVLVERGWLPSADAMHAPLARGRPPGAGKRPGRLSPADARSSGDGVRGPATADTVEGLLLPGAEGDAGLRTAVMADGGTMVMDRLAPGAVADSLPYPVLPFYVRRLAGAGRNAATELPAALEAPPLDDGPHLGYAVQWFSFAAIALVGTGAYLRSERRGEGAGAHRS